MRAGRKADLVVHDKVNAATGIIAANARKAEAFPNNALPCKGGIAMQQHRQNLCMLALTNIITEGLVGAHLTQHHWVHRFQVRWIGHKAHMHVNAVKFAVS